MQLPSFMLILATASNVVSSWARSLLRGLAILVNLDEAVAAIEVSGYSVRSEAPDRRVAGFLAGINARHLVFAAHQLCAAPFRSGSRAGVAFAARFRRGGQAVGNEQAAGHNDDDAGQPNKKPHFDHQVKS